MAGFPPEAVVNVYSVADLPPVLECFGNFSRHAAGKSVMFLVALGHPDPLALGLAS